jgi:hypothetical protein
VTRPRWKLEGETVAKGMKYTKGRYIMIIYRRQIILFHVPEGRRLEIHQADWRREHRRAYEVPAPKFNRRIE